MAFKRPDALACVSIPDLDAGGPEHKEGAEVSARCAKFRGGRRRVSRLVVAAADDPALLQADARQPALMTLQPADERARPEVPEPDAAVTRGAREQVAVK